MKRKKKQPLTPREFYESKGLEMAIKVHVSKATHDALMEEARASERSLQKVVRRILDKHTGTAEVSEAAR